MFPLRNSAASSLLTPVNAALIGLNLLIFWYVRTLGPAALSDILHYALIPARITAPGQAAESIMISASAIAPLTESYSTMLTSMFLHINPWHLAGNMLYLLVFGSAVEERMGSARYLL